MALESITLKFSEAPHSLTVPAQGVTIFVGPNNSGKSLVLREIESDAISSERKDGKIIKEVVFAKLTKDEAEAEFQRLDPQPSPQHGADYFKVGRFRANGIREEGVFHRPSFENQLAYGLNDRWLREHLHKHFVLRLDGRTRFDLTNDRNRDDLLGTAQNILGELFRNNTLRKKVSDIVHDAFGLYFVIDALSANHYRIRLSSEVPTADEQNLNAAAREFHSKAVHIKDASDGVQAFVGILCTILAGPYDTLLIDEPEAFLHPPLARKLGYELTANLKETGSLFASTHSADFLVGCLQAGVGVRVVRLAYSGGKSKAHLVDTETLNKFFKSPLFRSANVISALFYDGVIVTESDNDRAFYSEIYYRLAENDKRYPSILFVNAQNKQTICDIMMPLRKFGVPAAAIVDIDILKDGGADWQNWLSASDVPEMLRAGYGMQRADIKKRYTGLGLDMKSLGVEGLPHKDQAAANQLFDMLDGHGVFVVRGGELENWLKPLGVPGKKTDWTIAMLERLGGDPQLTSYVQPASDDVWAFLRKAVSWTRDAARKGTS